MPRNSKSRKQKVKQDLGEDNERMKIPRFVENPNFEFKLKDVSSSNNVFRVTEKFTLKVFRCTLDGFDLFEEKKEDFIFLMFYHLDSMNYTNRATVEDQWLDRTLIIKIKMRNGEDLRDFLIKKKIGGGVTRMSTNDLHNHLTEESNNEMDALVKEIEDENLLKLREEETERLKRDKRRRKKEAQKAKSAKNRNIKEEEQKIETEQVTVVNDPNTEEENNGMDENDEVQQAKVINYQNMNEDLKNLDETKESQQIKVENYQNIKENQTDVVEELSEPGNTKTNKFPKSLAGWSVAQLQQLCDFELGFMVGVL